MAIAKAHPPDALALRLVAGLDLKHHPRQHLSVGRSADGPHLEGTIGPTDQAYGVAN
jgi:hypothetical protein